MRELRVALLFSISRSISGPKFDRPRKAFFVVATSLQHNAYIPHECIPRPFAASSVLTAAASKPW
jgi:hypothetical protein